MRTRHMDGICTTGTRSRARYDHSGQAKRARRCDRPAAVPGHSARTRRAGSRHPIRTDDGAEVHDGQRRRWPLSRST